MVVCPAGIIVPVNHERLSSISEPLHKFRRHFQGFLIGHVFSGPRIYMGMERFVLCPDIAPAQNPDSLVEFFN